MAQIRNVDGLVMGQTGNNPMIMGTRMVSNAKGTPGPQYRYTIAGGNPIMHIKTRFYLSLSQTNVPSEDFWTTQICSLSTYFDTNGNGQVGVSLDNNDNVYVGFGQSFSTRQADAWFWNAGDNGFPVAISTVAFIWCNRWDFLTISLL
jgi:hypothetical protein